MGADPAARPQPRGDWCWSGWCSAAAGCALTGLATSLYGIATAYALASVGFGFTRPGFTAGSSLAVGPAAQGSVAGKVTSVNGASFVLGPSIGVGLYEAQHSLPYLTRRRAACCFGYAWCRRIFMAGAASWLRPRVAVDGTLC